MKKSKLHKLIDEKLAILNDSPKVFQNDALEIQNRLFAEVKKLLNRFKSTNGRLDTDQSNTTLVNSLNKRIKNILKSQPLKSVTSRFVKNFDKIEGLSTEIIGGVNDVEDLARRLNISQDKRDAIDDIVDGLLNQTSLNRQIGRPIRKILFRHITIGISRADAEAELKEFITGNSNLGVMERYVRNLAQDSLNRYDGLINQRAADEFGLDAFRIVNSLIATSHITCVEMVTETGVIGKYARNGKYLVKDIPKFIAVMRTRSGFVRGTTKANYFINRNHWGCRHTLIPTKLLRRDRDSFDENVEEDIEEINGT